VEKDDKPDPQILAVIAEALNRSQPALILEIIEAIRAPGRGRKKFASVEAAAATESSQGSYVYPFPRLPRRCSPSRSWLALVPIQAQLVPG
jgi:hypothetical protein